MNEAKSQFPRRVSARLALATALAAVALGSGVYAYARGADGDGPRGAYMSRPADPVQAEARVNRMLGHLYVEIDASDAQKQKIDPIVKAAARDLFPLRQKMRDIRRQQRQLFTAEKVDPAAIEKLSEERVKLTEQISRRFTKALVEVAEVLTPAQRQQLAERFGRFGGGHGRHGWRGRG
ncbi:MAG: Spy/CpxP family protein refolding chaperone [Sphingomonadaceae bacterium]